MPVNKKARWRYFISLVSLFVLVLWVGGASRRRLRPCWGPCSDSAGPAYPAGSMLLQAPLLKGCGAWEA